MDPKWDQNFEFSKIVRELRLIGKDVLFDCKKYFWLGTVIKQNLKGYIYWVLIDLYKS